METVTIELDGQFYDCDLELVKQAAVRVSRAMWSIQTYEQANERLLRLNPRWARQLTDLKEILQGA